MFKATTDTNSFEINQNKEKISINGESFLWDLTKVGDSSFHIIKDNKSYNVEVLSANREEKTFDFKINGKKHKVELKDKMDLLLEKLGMDKLVTNQVNDVKAPMPGLILSIDVNEGSEVKKGDPILILEAMKMENVLKSPGDGVVKSIKVSQSDSVEKNQILIQF